MRIKEQFLDAICSIEHPTLGTVTVNTNECTPEYLQSLGLDWLLEEEPVIVKKYKGIDTDRELPL